MRFIHREETIPSVIEEGNFVGPSNDANMEEANAQPHEKAMLLLINGLALCLFVSEIFREFLLLAAVGSVLTFIGSVRLICKSRWFRLVGVISVFQILWRTTLLVFSYLPSGPDGVLWTWLGYGLAALSLLQLIFFRKALCETDTWKIPFGRLPVLEIGYAGLLVLSFLGGTVCFLIKIVIGCFLIWLLYRVYRSAEQPATV